MDDIFISQQKAKLEHEKKRLKEEISDTSKYPEMGNSDDDREQEITQFEENQALEDNLETELDAVNHALKRVDSGTYGKCKICGGDISRERLEAYPAAEDCMTCSTKK